MNGMVFLIVGRKKYDRPFVSSCLAFSQHRDDIFIVGGQDAIQARLKHNYLEYFRWIQNKDRVFFMFKVWKFDETDKKLSNTMISLAKIRRQINVLMVRLNFFFLDETF